MPALPFTVKKARAREEDEEEERGVVWGARRGDEDALWSFFGATLYILRSTFHTAVPICYSAAVSIWCNNKRGADSTNLTLVRILLNSGTRCAQTANSAAVHSTCREGEGAPSNNSIGVQQADIRPAGQARPIQTLGTKSL